MTNDTFVRSPSQSSQESIYFNSHSPDTIPLNVTNAHIVDSSTEHLPLQEVPDTRDILLPNQPDGIRHLSIDIGGSLLKLVYYSKDDKSGGGRFTFLKIETEAIDKFISTIKSVLREHYRHDTERDQFNEDVTIMATGGGAFKFYDRLTEELKCHVVKLDEMQCLIVGLDFFIKEIPNEIFTTDNNNPLRYINEDNTSSLDVGNGDSIYPYLLVNIGSGVSMIKVTGAGASNFVRVGGSSLGGGTLWGLLSVLTSLDDFDEMLELAIKGDNENVDLLVGDIYGHGYNKIGLKSNHIASSFGKVFKEIQQQQKQQQQQHDDVSMVNDEDAIRQKRLERLTKFNEADIARSLLYAVSNNIGQIAYLQAQRYNLKKIYFAGSYIRGHPQTIHTLSYAINFWSNGEKKLYFLKHEGYLGSMGAFLQKKRNDMNDDEL